MKTSEHASKRKKRGRQTLLIPALKKRICAMLQHGHTVKTTVAACGISPRCYHDHCEQDAAFLAATQRARACGRVRIAESILHSDDWRAKAWYLERTDPEQYARTEERQLVIQHPPVRDNTINYGQAAATLRIVLAQTQDEAKKEVLRSVLADVEAEDAKFSALIESWREQGLL